MDPFTFVKASHAMGDIYAIRNGMHRKNSVMDVVIISEMQIFCLLQSTKSSDCAIKKAENEKFRNDARSSEPIYSIQFYHALHSPDDGPFRTPWQPLQRHS
jgi:hypothetical protein